MPRWLRPAVRPYSGVMSNPETDDKSFADLLAENGRPVSDEGWERARRSLAEARARRDPDARAALVASLRRAA